MTITREEFDALAARVAAIEDRTASQFGYIFVELHKINERLDHHDGRFDHIALKIDEVIRRLG